MKKIRDIVTITGLTLLLTPVARAQDPSPAAEGALCPSCGRVHAPATPDGTPEAAPTAEAYTFYGSDPYGFAAILNTYRASAGLPPVAYDANLSAWASQNNAAQCVRGLGHHINPNCFQNCAWNSASAWEAAQSWINSPGHRANLLSPSITRFGIAYGPGPYWTFNAQ